jgi:hypothetical protein
MDEKSPCPRCGMMLWAGQMPQHMPTCERLPLPADLRREFEASGMSVHAFALQYCVAEGARRYGMPVPAAALVAVGVAR